jgi:hypothetical protein
VSMAASSFIKAFASIRRSAVHAVIGTHCGTCTPIEMN